MHNSYVSKWVKEIRFFFLFLLVVLISTIPSLMYWHQPILKSLYVIYPWAYSLVFLVMIVKNYNLEEVYVALKKFTILFAIIMVIALIMPYRITGGELGADLDMSRGISRVRMGGTYYMHLFGILNMVLYCQTRKNSYFKYYLLCLVMVVLAVSRQHIAIYSCLTLGFLLFNVNMGKKLQILIVGAILGLGILPQTDIYQGLVMIEHNQDVIFEGQEGNVRLLAAEYFINDFPRNNVTRLIGNCQYNMDSQYGKLIEDLRVFFLSDIGFVGIYIYYGIVGLLLLFYMLYYTIKTRVEPEYMGFKLFIFYLFLTNILSHSFDMAQVGIAIALYFIASQSLQNKQLLQY